MTGRVRELLRRWRPQVERFMWRVLATDGGPFLIAWMGTWPLMAVMYVMRSVDWVRIVAGAALYIAVYRALPSRAAVARRLARLDAEERL